MAEANEPAGVVLALDTSTDVNVGVARGPEVLGRARVSDRMAHVERLTPLVRQCLAGAGLALPDVGSVVVGLGPGPFTGLRVGIVSAQVLAAVLWSTAARGLQFGRDRAGVRRRVRQLRRGDR